MKRGNEVTVIEYPHGDGIRVVRGDYSVSSESGVPSAIRVYNNMNQAYAAERGRARMMLERMMISAL